MPPAYSLLATLFFWVLKWHFLQMPSIGAGTAFNVIHVCWVGVARAGLALLRKQNIYEYDPLSWRVLLLDPLIDMKIKTGICLILIMYNHMPHRFFSPQLVCFCLTFFVVPWDTVSRWRLGRKVVVFTRSFVKEGKRARDFFSTKHII